jgi:DNA-binding XRE family transcriptional regulator
VKNRGPLKKLGEKIRKQRDELKLTQECLAELAGIHWKTLGRIERGEFACSVLIFNKLAQYLQVNATQLLEGIEKIDTKRVSRITKALDRKRATPKKRAPFPTQLL